MTTGFTGLVTEVYEIGPRRVATLSKGCIGVYLPKELSSLRGKRVLLTIKVLKDAR